MSAAITLTSGMSQNLYSLQRTEELMEETEYRLATGKRVNSALDDPINYFAAENHTQRATDLEARKDEMGEGVQLIEAANAGIEAITDLIDSAKSLAQSALSAETKEEANALETQFTEVMAQIDDVAADSGYKGVNLLGGATETLQVNYDEEGDSSSTLTGFDASSTGLGITAVAADAWWDDSGTPEVADKTAIYATIDQLDKAKSTLRSETKDLSTDLGTITARQSFTENMINTLNDGAANLVNADLNEESANLLMLQTQQQLGTNSLSIASDSMQSVLKLF